MATLNELAEKYAEMLLKSTNKKIVADEIVTNINQLGYSKSKKQLTYADKEELIKKLYYYLNNPTSNVLHYLSIEKSDNKNFLELISYINNKLKDDDQ